MPQQILIELIRIYLVVKLNISAAALNESATLIYGLRVELLSHRLTLPLVLHVIVIVQLLLIFLHLVVIRILLHRYHAVFDVADYFDQVVSILSYVHHEVLRWLT